MSITGGGAACSVDSSQRATGMKSTVQTHQAGSEDEANDLLRQSPDYRCRYQAQGQAIHTTATCGRPPTLAEAGGGGWTRISSMEA
jgi:hypothetical protein